MHGRAFPVERFSTGLRVSADRRARAGLHVNVNRRFAAEQSALADRYREPAFSRAAGAGGISFSFAAVFWRRGMTASAVGTRRRRFPGCTAISVRPQFPWADHTRNRAKTRHPFCPSFACRARHCARSNGNLGEWEKPCFITTPFPRLERIGLLPLRGVGVKDWGRNDASAWPRGCSRCPQRESNGTARRAQNEGEESACFAALG